MSRGIVGLRGYQNGGGILDPDDDIPEWMRRLQEQLERRGTSDQDIHRITEGMQERLTEAMGRPDWDPVNEGDLAEFILGDPSEWDLPELIAEHPWDNDNRYIFPESSKDNPKPLLNFLDRWNIKADMDRVLGDVEPWQLQYFSEIDEAYKLADPEGQELLEQLLRRVESGAYDVENLAGPDIPLDPDRLLRDYEDLFKSDPQSVEDLLGQVRSEAEMDERYERAIQKYLEQNPDVDIHNIHESMDLDDLERLEREVLRGTPGGLTPDIDRIQDMTAAELEEAFGEFDDDNVIEELASRTESPFEKERIELELELQEELEELQRRREAGIASVDPVERAAARRAASYAHVGEGIRTPEEQRWLEVFFNKPGQRTPEEIAKFEIITGLETAGPAPEPIYPRASVPESRGARVGGAARRFARSLPWKEAAAAGIGTLAGPLPVLIDLAAEFGLNPSEMGSGTPYWREEGYRTPEEREASGRYLGTLLEDLENTLPYTGARWTRQRVGPVRPR